MNRNLLILAMLALAACSRQGAEPAAPVASPAADMHVDRPTSAIGHGKLAAPLPEGLVFDFPNEVRSDRLVTTKSGKHRRKVTFEYLKGDSESVFESVSTSLQVAGFTPGARKDPGNGKSRMNFSKPKFGRITVVVTSSIAKPRNPQAVGAVVLDLPAPASMQ